MSTRFLIRHRRVALGILGWTLCSGAMAQGADPSCTALLTADKIAKAAGEPFKDRGSEITSSGASECEWAARGGTPAARALSMTFYGNVALKKSPAYANADEYFEASIVPLETKWKAKRENLPGVGLRAAFLQTGPKAELVVVKRADGVARLIGVNMSKEHMMALARAIAAP